MTRTITPYEQNGVCGVVEGQQQAVDQFLANAAGVVQRGRSRRSAIDDKLTTNQRHVVKVTTYEPVQEPLGMPTMNNLFGDQLEYPGSVPGLFDESKHDDADTEKPVKKKPALYIAGPPPTDNGPLGLPDMQWDTPPETAEGERATTNTANESGPQQNKRQAKTAGGGPLGLPSMDW